MSETRTERFERVAAPRIANAIKAITLLNNLVGSDYESTLARRQEIVARLQKGLDNLADTWKVRPRSGVIVIAPADREAAGAALAATANREAEPRLWASRAVEAVGLARKADGGASVEQEIRWAIDLIARGDYHTADSRLRKIVLGRPPEAWEEAV